MTRSKRIEKKPNRSGYDQDHPTRSFRLTRESNERLQAYLEATGSSISDLIERALDNPPIESPDIGKIKDAEYSEGYYEGYEDGYEWAESRFSCPTGPFLTRRARRRVIEVYKTRKKG
jgi:hypothetical protein